MSASIVVVDNDDSFVHILGDLLWQAGANVAVRGAREIDDADAAIAACDGVLVSPGPGAPADARASAAVVRAATARRLPLLGVCLGHQVIAESFGASVARAPELRHGMTSLVTHDGSGLYSGPGEVPDTFEAGRYHSLAVVESSLPAELRIDARAEGGTIMGFSHRSLPIWGVQYHPESVLTPAGPAIVANWLSRCTRTA